MSEFRIRRMRDGHVWAGGLAFSPRDSDARPIESLLIATGIGLRLFSYDAARFDVEPIPATTIAFKELHV